MIITNVILGKSVRLIHSLIPYKIIIIISYSNETICKITIIFVITMLILFIRSGKCFISNYERRLLNDNINVVDPYLKLFRLKINRYNRKYVSIYGILILQILIANIYYYRFIYKYGVISKPYGS